MNIYCYLLLYIIICHGLFSDDEFKVGCDWTRAAFSSSGKYAAVGSSDGTVFIFDVATARVERRLKEHK